jgi:RNA polymerase sigma-70 factor (ECF subfamily)
MKKKTTNPDAHLVLLLRQDNLKAFDQLYFKYHKKLYYFAKGYLKSNEKAEGLVQEVFIRIWTNRHKIDEEQSFNAFIYSVAYHAILNIFRKEARERKYINQYRLFRDLKSNNTSLDVEYNNLKELANDVIEKLPQKRKVVFKLSREEGLSNQEIAEKLGISKKTVENQIHSALKFIKEELGKGSILNILFFFLFLY